ncbi:RagB/SusD family nutrient uptake outer membrane protein [Sunxiuqinia sp. A32]|uniref:RagB/SusD family nutrient uptake outer membrane protein n=1 Tax=Sunxiuqinia sp. A32 TaxID=3461496 RepID=UPI00404649E8
MKKTIYIFLLSASMLFSGCSDFLEEDMKGQVLGDAILTSQVGLESALTGAYRGLSNTWYYGFTTGWSTEMSLGGDDITTLPGTGQAQEFDRLGVKSTNASASPVFLGCYKAIQGANNVILAYENTKGDENTIQIIAGEAYFLRAFSYFWLVRCHGELPLVLTADFSADMFEIEKASVAEIYQQIESDLEQAEAMLADTKREDGRPNVGSAKALLAEVYLHEAGWPLKDESKYAMAAAKAKEVIDNKETYGFGLVSTFDELYENDETKSSINQEHEFVIPCNKTAGNTMNTTYGFFSYPGEIGGWDGVFSELTFYNDFPEGPRKEATFATSFTTQTGVTLTWQELQYKRPYYKKLMKNENVANFYSYNSSLPLPLLRYTQTILTYAEAKARSGGPDALAYDCINEIRQRAGLENYSGLSAAEFVDAAVNERAWELCAETVRWFDIVRLDIVPEVYSGRDPSDNQPFNVSISEAQYLFPIPEHDLLLNPNLN